jgi:hypothetical protein
MSEPFVVDQSGLEPAVIQGLVNHDPDVDAVYRMIHMEPFYFDKNLDMEVRLDKYTVCPFNTQNTTWLSNYQAMYLPTTVAFRYTDILRSYVALFQIWKNNRTVSFTGPSAVQFRNEHDIQKDYIDEQSMRDTMHTVVEILTENKDGTLEQVYEKLYQIGVVQSRELDTLRAWLQAVKNF